MAHPMAGGSYCAVIDGVVTFKGNSKEAHRRVSKAREDQNCDRRRTFVGLSLRLQVGDTWPETVA